MKLSELNDENIIDILVDTMNEDANREGGIPNEYRDFTDFQILANNRDDDYPNPLADCPHVKDREYPTDEEIEKILTTIRKCAEDEKITVLHIDGFFRTPAPEYGEDELMTSGHWSLDIEVDRPADYVREAIGPVFEVASNVRVRAHDLWAEPEGGWTSNDRFEIHRVSLDSNLEVDTKDEEKECIDAILGRLEVFKANYDKDATPSDIADISDWSPTNPFSEIMLEVNQIPFVDIEIEIDPLKLIRWLTNEIERELFTIHSKGDYISIIYLIIHLAEACHAYEGETEDWLYINEFGHATPDNIIIGAHWHGAEWHGGQHCPVYRMISATGTVFSPGCASGPEPESSEKMVYDALEEMAQKRKDETLPRDLPRDPISRAKGGY